MSPNPYARWQYREDRFDFRLWLASTHIGFVADIEHCPGLLLRMKREGEFARYQIDEVLGRHELELCSFGWRVMVAHRLRYMRAQLRDALRRVAP